MVFVVLAVRWAVPHLDALLQLMLFYVLCVANLIGFVAVAQSVGYYLGYRVEYFHREAYPIFRVYGTFSEPNPYGNFIAGIALLSLVLARSPQLGRFRSALYYTTAFQLTLLLANLSRGPWVGFVVGAVLLAVLDAVKVGRLWRAASGLLLTGILVTTLLAAVYLLAPHAYVAMAERVGVGQALSPTSQATARSRLADFYLSLNAWRAHPLFGSGLGGWGATAYGLSGRDARVPPRDIFLSWLYEKGLVGSVIALWMYGAVGWYALRQYLATSDPIRPVLILANLTAVSAVFTTFLFTRADITPHYWLLIGLVLAAAEAPSSVPAQ
jgi:hypothetical protein